MNRLKDREKNILVNNIYKKKKNRKNGDKEVKKERK